MTPQPDAEFGLRAIVTGGRDYADADVVNEALTRYKVTELAQGGASGADRLAALWAHDNGVPCVTFAADWAKHGKAAGPTRNRHMLDTFRPDVVIAFPGGRGTADMVRYAESCGVPVVMVDDGRQRQQHSIPARIEQVSGPTMGGLERNAQQPPPGTLGGLERARWRG